MIITLIRNTETNIFASSNISSNNKNLNNVAVLLYSFDDPYMLQIMQNLKDIQNENPNKIRYDFYDGKNNVAIQEETLDYVLNSDIDLIIINLADKREQIVEDIIQRVKSKDIPLILADIDPQIVSKVSKYYNKAAFILSNLEEAGIVEGKILVDQWNNNKKTLDKNNDNILQYVLLQGKANNIVATERTKSVISTLNNSGIKTDQLALVNADWSKEIAKNAIEALILRYNDKIEAIISNNDAMAIGAIETLQKYGYNKGNASKYISVVGIDALSEARDLVNKGFMTGTVFQDAKPFAEAYYIIGMNLINNLDPIENTNYKYSDGNIIVPIDYKEYTGPPNTP